jgi:1-aminocyclopropane-1-carboxylate deaminase/D-cysteine desulfhydrase-like pyridoxal-dependent ACC family enzyme
VFPVLKGFDSIQEMQALAQRFECEEEWELNKHRLRVFSDYHFSGYGKGSQEAQQALSEFQVSMHFDLDNVYTLKAFVGLLTELKQQHNALKGLFIHTGGVFSQGLF